MPEKWPKVAEKARLQSATAPIKIFKNFEKMIFRGRDGTKIIF